MAMTIYDSKSRWQLELIGTLARSFYRIVIGFIWVEILVASVKSA